MPDDVTLHYYLDFFLGAMFVTSGISVFLMQIIYYAAGKMTLLAWLKRNMEIKRSCSLLNVRH
jgi:hypothetical protein